MWTLSYVVSTWNSLAISLALLRCLRSNFLWAACLCRLMTRVSNLLTRYSSWLMKANSLATSRAFSASSAGSISVATCLGKYLWSRNTWTNSWEARGDQREGLGCLRSGWLASVTCFWTFCKYYGIPAPNKLLFHFICFIHKLHLLPSPFSQPPKTFCLLSKHPY